VITFDDLRRNYDPRYPKVFSDFNSLTIETGSVVEPKIEINQRETLKTLFPNLFHLPILKFKNANIKNSKPLRVGVVLSGGQAPGGHNVIIGIHDALMKISKDSFLLGFLGGPSGILENKTKILTQNSLYKYKNSGGFDLLGSGRTKIETEEQFKKCKEVLQSNNLNGLIIIGGDDSNTNAALLAEYLKKEKSDLSVIGVPKTIDGDLKNEYVETSFGFDTAVKVYAELVSNIERDALSAAKYYHFIRLMGRSASRLTLEVALLTHPNIVVISEEVQSFKKTLSEVIDDIVKIIVERAAKGKNYGVVLIPEGIVEFIPEAHELIDEINSILGENMNFFSTLRGFTEQSEFINRKLSRSTSYVFSTLPIDIQRQLLMDRDPHGNVQVSKIDTEKLFIEMVTQRLKELKAKGVYKGKFSSQNHFIGYEGRCAYPSNFDADYSYSLGLAATALMNEKVSGYMAVVRNLTSPRKEWEAIGVPLVSMMNIEIRHGKPKPVIKKSLVGLEDKPFQFFVGKRRQWAIEDDYRYVEPIQYFGPDEITDKVPLSLLLERGMEL